MTLLAFMSAMAIAYALGSLTFYSLGYRKGYQNGMHTSSCHIHTGEQCTCDQGYWGIN